MTTQVYGQDAIPIGGGEVAKIGGAIFIDTGAVGTDADTNEKDLMSYSLPANTLLKDGQGLRLKAQFSSAANANVKTYKLYFGATVMNIGPGVVNGLDVVIVADIFRTGVGTQDIFEKTQVSGAAGARLSPTATEDETGAIVTKITGQNGTAAENDIVGELLSAEFINAE